MATLFISNFGQNSTSTLVEWNSVVGASIQSVVKQSGSYAGQITSLSSGTAKYFRCNLAASASNGPFFMKAAWRFDSFPSAENRFWAFQNSTTPGTSVVVYLTVDNIGQVRLYDEDGQIGSASSALNTQSFYCIEVQYDRTGVAGSHVVRARISQVEFAGAADRSLSSGGFLLFHGGNLANESQTTGDWYVANVIVNNNSGSFQNTYSGDVYLTYLRPNASGDNNAWTNDYTAVDEETPNDATDFQSSNTSGQIIDHNIDAVPSEIKTYSLIRIVAVGSRARGSGASANASYVVRCKASASGTVEESSASTPGSTTWATHGTTTVLTPKLVMYDMPGAATIGWTRADFAATQIGARISTSNTNTVDLTALWLIIGYIKTPRTGPISRSLATTRSVINTNRTIASTRDIV